MMKKLFIVRHSKAVEFARDHSDFNRCLADAGIKKAVAIANKLTQTQSEADLLISSPACRALETAKIFASALEYPDEDIQLMDTLYHFGGIQPALDIISAVPSQVQSLFLFGHNPTFNALAWHLCDGFRDAMPTCAVVGVTFSAGTWPEALQEKGQLSAYLTKKNI